MASDKTCCCLSYSSAVITLGMLQLNAALYFLARFTCFTQFYWYFDLAIALVYIWRVVAFFSMTSDDTSDNRKTYYNTQKNGAYLFIPIAIAYNATNFLEWGHFPQGPFIAWAMMGLLNYQNTQMLKNFWE